MLVEPALQVGKPSLDGILGMTAHPNLVGDKDEGGRLLYELRKLRLKFLQRLLDIRIVIEKEVGSPKSHAIYHHHTVSEVVAAEEFLLFDVGPHRTTICLMAFHTKTKIIVPDARGGQVNGIFSQLESQSLSVAALS